MGRFWEGVQWFCTGVIMTGAFIGHAVQPYLDALFGIQTKN